MGDYFCGWYFRCQSEDVIPAVHRAGAARSRSTKVMAPVGQAGRQSPSPSQ